MRISDASIRGKLFSFYVLAGIVPLVLVVLLCVHFAGDALLDKSFNQLTTVQSLRKNRIEQDFGLRIESVRRLNQRNDIINLFTEIGNLPTLPGNGAINFLSPEYQAIIDRYTPSLRHYLSTFGYADLVLVSASGRVLYSIESQHLPGVQLDTGAMLDTGLTKLWQRISVTRQTAMIDFLPYADNGHDDYAAFIGQPFFGADRKMAGIIAIRLGPDLIDKIVDSRDGMGKTGESYIVAFDRSNAHYEFRTTVRTTGETRWHMGKTMPSLPYWEAARTGSGHTMGEYVDSAGNPVLIALDTLYLQGVDWFLVSKIDRDEVLAPVRSLAIDMSALGFFMAMFMGIGALLFSNNFTAPIFKATGIAESIAKGNLDVAIDTTRKDELGVLLRALDAMAQRLRAHDWLRSGSERIDSALRGEHDPTILAEKFLSTMVQHFGVPLGAVYLTRNDAKMLNLSARYGWTERDAERFGHVGFGDGMVGQAAVEREPIYFSTSTGDTPMLDYGAGEVKPQWFAAVPLLFEGATLGVMLLGAFASFTENQRSFIRDIARNVGVLIAAADSHQTIEVLLHRAQEQEVELRANNAELHRQAQALIESERELQTQQEELRVINEELEEQTRALRKSESELQAQQEELRVTNEELEERTHELEERSKAIQAKNDALVAARDEIRQKIKELETANRYKSEFLANMSHELRTPLNSILILSQLMGENRGGNLTQRQIESARTINASGSDLLKLINDILDLSKVEAGKIEITIEQTAIDGFIADLERVFLPVSEARGIPFGIKVEADAPQSLMTDSHRLQQVMRNLLSNAFKFTDPGGEVSLTVKRPTAAELPQGSTLDPADAVAFVVRDQGIGIPADRQAEIFEAFRQADGGTSRKYGGTGLGLSISRRLAEALGGMITLESSPGKGSAFSVVLPASAPAVASAVATVLAAEPEAAVAGFAPPDVVLPPPERPKPKASSQGLQMIPPPPDAVSDEVPDDRRSISSDDKTLLIVEDDANFAAILRDLAHERGFKCLIASEGETGLHFADYYRPSAIILDVGLPGIDGWEVMSRLKSNSETRHIPVHFISGADNSMDALRMGAVGFLTKPINLERIEEAFTKIEDVINKPVSNLLVVEDDAVQADAIRQLIGDNDVASTIASSGGEALELLAHKPFDCMILDLGLKDISGFELLERMRSMPGCARLPVIIYTGRELTKTEEEQLQRHAESIIIKGVRSPERLLDESALFLHRVEAALPERQRAMIRMVHDRDATLKERTVLLVDDDMRNVFALSSVLEDKGLTVVIARDGRESLDRLKEHPEVDLVLMDIMMPEMDGYEAMREIRKDRTHAKLPIIALTAKAMKGDRNKCIEAGANDYLAKPVNTEKLLSLLRVWLYK
jgi:CheY-like chemotaxis protein